jgi:hypothetical protein
VIPAVGADSAHGLFISQAQEERRPMGTRDPPATFVSKGFSLRDRVTLKIEVAEERTAARGKDEQL